MRQKTNKHTNPVNGEADSDDFLISFALTHVAEMPHQFGVPPSHRQHVVCYDVFLQNVFRHLKV